MTRSDSWDPPTTAFLALEWDGLRVGIRSDNSICIGAMVGPAELVFALTPVQAQVVRDACRGMRRKVCIPPLLVGPTLEGVQLGIAGVVLLIPTARMSDVADALDRCKMWSVEHAKVIAEGARL